MKVVCSIVEAGWFSTVAVEEIWGGAVAPGALGAAMPAPSLSTVLGRTKAGELVAPTGAGGEVNREAGLTGGAFLIRLAGFWEVVEPKVVVGDNGRMGCGWLIWIPSSSGISLVWSKAEIQGEC